MIQAIFIKSLLATLKISMIIFVLMIIIEILVLKYQKQIIKFLSKNKYSSLGISSFFGIIPGCVGTFAMDTAYMSGLLGFGGIVAVMIATSGDETFVMISMLLSGELSAISLVLLVVSLFFLGIIGGLIAEIVKKKLHLKTCTKCKIQHHKKVEFKLKHFFKEHIIQHILKKHIWKIALWIFVALFLIDLTSKFIDLNLVLSNTNPVFLLLLAGLIGLLPISGPNIFLLIMFSKGLIPFSILLTNSIIQDGHGLLPIIGFSIDDAIKIKIINFIFGMFVGGLLLLIGF